MEHQSPYHHKCPICLNSIENSGANTLAPVLIFVGWLSRPWAEAVADISDKAVECGHYVKIVDISKFTYPPAPKPIEAVLKGYRSLVNIPVQSIEGQEIEVDNASEYFLNQHTAISSELMTKYRGAPSLLLTRTFSMEMSMLKSLSSSLYQQVVDTCDSNALWVIPNGRLSHQRALSSAADDLNTNVMFYELSRFPDRYFLRGYSPHQRKELQGEFLELKDTVPLVFLNSAQQYLVDRTSNESVSNRFTRRFNNTSIGLSSREISGKVAVFFSSSRDELEALGPDWSLSGWEDQYEAFDAIMGHLQNCGFTIILRLHPNLANKSSTDIRTEIQKIDALKKSHPALKVYYPRDRTNSYALLNVADVVVVARSTIGLEGLAKGKKVVHVGDTFYDLLPGLLRFGRSSKITDLESFLKGELRAGGEAVSFLAFEYYRDALRLSSGQIRPASLVEKLRYIFNKRTLLFFTSFSLAKILSLLAVLRYLVLRA